VVASFNPSARTVAPTSAIDTNTASTTKLRQKCRISTKFETNALEAYRHWFTVLDDRALALDLQLQQHSEMFNEQYNFGSDQIAALEVIGVPRQETVCCIGRICYAVRNKEHYDGRFVRNNSLISTIFLFIIISFRTVTHQGS
jgi:hypothetical protein